MGKLTASERSMAYKHDLLQFLGLVFLILYMAAIVYFGEIGAVSSSRKSTGSGLSFPDSVSRFTGSTSCVKSDRELEKCKKTTQLMERQLLALQAEKTSSAPAHAPATMTG